jgi:hypothetical protein
VFLNKNDITKIQEVLSKFPEVEYFEINQETGSGIGSVTTMTFTYEVNGYVGQFEIELSGVEDW